MTEQADACVRCGGRLYEVSDQYGAYVYCLMCGAHVEQRPLQLQARTPGPRLQAHKL